MREFKKPEGMPETTFISAGAWAKEDREGVMVEGEFIGTMTMENDEGKELEHFKFRTDEGNTIVIYTFASLARQMSFVKIGQYVQVSYLGKDKITKGKMKGKSLHKAEVLVAE